MKKRLLAHDGNFARTFSTEDGQDYRGVHQEMAPLLKHKRLMQDMQPYRTNKGGLAEEYRGSVPKSVLTAWLRKTNNTAHEWAINAGGNTYDVYAGGPGVKDDFMAYFEAKFPAFVADRGKGSQIVVPGGIQRENQKHTGDSGTGLVKP